MTRETDNESFVRDFQRRYGLMVDGWAGKATGDKLAEVAPKFTADGGKLGKPAEFFDLVRVHFGSLTTEQVGGFNELTGALAGWPVSWVAYALATAWHETAATMQPIKELGGEAYFTKRYDIQGQKPDLARTLGNVNPGDGARYAGRGYVQITGRTNYRRFGIENTPDDALNPVVAAHILKDGMERGSFTGKKLADYLPGDYVSARRIINGTDKAQMIAGYAVAFERALTAGGWQ